ncbi:hypothetical protein ACVW00_003874 [Marmoricola sp. URHA0025 HA25]
MNSIDEYQAEVAYRREQMLRGRGTLRQWLRARRPQTATTAGNRGH